VKSDDSVGSPRSARDTMRNPRIIVALDFADAGSALALAERLNPGLCAVKVGKELFTAAGPTLVERLVRLDYLVFLDLKYHDIPNTVASACRAATALGVWMINVHALGGRVMLEAAREALLGVTTAPKLVAVTLLTSMREQDLVDVGMQGSTEEIVLRLARLTQRCGLDGVVCSPREAAMLRRACGRDFCLVTPGIRPSEGGNDDQARVATPRIAMDNGADYLVIGRPITRAPDPLAALCAINSEIAGSPD